MKRFKIPDSQDSKKITEDATQMLTNINALVTKFMKTYENNKNEQNAIKKIIYEDKIYNNRKKVGQFSNLINHSTGVIDTDKIQEIRDQSQMSKKRVTEMENVKHFIREETTYMALTNGEDNRNNPYGGLKQLGDGNTAKKNKDDSAVNSDDDIKIEYIGKKHDRDQFKQVEKGKKKGEIIFPSCYICKKKFNEDMIHFFYRNLCKTCGEFNYNFRVLNIDLKGRYAVVTGGRVKIGYYIVLKLLLYGCTVISTTRFPKDALNRYKQEPGYEKFKDNLTFYPLDLRLLGSIENFITYLYERLPHLDILINNAAQTKRKATSFYKYLLEGEAKPLEDHEENMIIKDDIGQISLMSDGQGNTKIDFNSQNNKMMDNLKSNEKNQLMIRTKPRETDIVTNMTNLPLSVVSSQMKLMDEKEVSGPTIMGQDQQPIDFKENHSSWNMEIDEVPFQEFAEVQMINTWAPYYLCAKLKKLMCKSPFKDRYIVNVSAVEGIFNHFKKTTHPHTNMAKAALNMMTRTCGRYYKDAGIYMTAVDTGWVSPMNGFNNLLDKKSAKAFEEEYKNIPLDELDGAMRCIHPIIDGVRDKNYHYGYLFKDYKQSPW